MFMNIMCFIIHDIHHGYLYHDEFVNTLVLKDIYGSNLNLPGLPQHNLTCKQKCGYPYALDIHQMSSLSMEEKQGSDLEASTLHHIEAFQHSGFWGSALCQIYQTFHIQELGQA